MFPGFRIDVHNPTGGKKVYFEYIKLIEDAYNVCQERMKYHRNPFLWSVHPIFNQEFADLMLRSPLKFFLFHAQQLSGVEQNEGLNAYEGRLIEHSAEAHKQFCSIVTTTVLFAYLACSEKSICFSAVSMNKTYLNLVHLPSMITQHTQMLMLDDLGFYVKNTPYVVEKSSFVDFFSGEMNMGVQVPSFVFRLKDTPKRYFEEARVENREEAYTVE